jgi:hypothetical protein
VFAGSQDAARLDVLPSSLAGWSRFAADPFRLVGDHASIIGAEMTEASPFPSATDLPKEEIAVDEAIPEPLIFPVGVALIEGAAALVLR